MENLQILMLEDCRQDILFYSDLLRNSFDRNVKIRTSARLNPDLADRQYDLILLDLNLLDSEGVRTVKTCRGIFGEHIPIIVLTGTEDPNVRIKALMAGADDYLVKGADDKMLSERIIHYVFDRYELVKRGHEDKRFL